MPYVDAGTGEAVPDDALIGAPAVNPANYPVRDPKVVAHRLGQLAARVLPFAKRNAVPIGAQLGGQALGELGGDVIAAALAPESGGASLALPIILGALGAGAANVGAARALPPALGGAPKESPRRAFLWGAVPAAVGGGVPRLIGSAFDHMAAARAAQEEAQFAEKAASAGKASHGELLGAIEGAHAATQEPAYARAIASAIGAPGGVSVEAPEAGDRLAEAGKNAVLGPIQRLSHTLGEPIGNAYRALKGADRRLTPAEFEALQSRLADIQSSLIAPAPETAAAAARLAPAPAPDLTNFRGLSAANLGRAEASARRAGRSVPTLEDLQSAAAPEPPTLDELRQARQRVNQRLRAMRGRGGGDLYGLDATQEALDDALEPYVENPGQLATQRRAYAKFRQRFPYAQLAQLQKAQSPGAVADWLFGQDPQFVREIVQHATPAERGEYQQLLARKVLEGVDLDSEGAASEVARRLRPLSANGTLRTLYGDGAADAQFELLETPVRLKRAVADLRRPEGRARFAEGFATAARSATPAQRDAAQAGLEQWASALPPAQRDTLLRFVQPPGASEQPVLEAPAGALKRRLAGGGVGRFYNSPWAKTYIVGELGLTALGVTHVMPTYVAAIGLGIGTLGAANLTYRAIMRSFGADAIAKIVARPSARAVGAAFFKALAVGGGRVLHDANAPPGGEADAG